MIEILETIRNGSEYNYVSLRNSIKQQSFIYIVKLLNSSISDNSI